MKVNNRDDLECSTLEAVNKTLQHYSKVFMDFLIECWSLIWSILDNIEYNIIIFI